VARTQDVTNLFSSSHVSDESPELNENCRKRSIRRIRNVQLSSFFLNDLGNSGIVHEANSWEQVVLHLQVETAGEEVSNLSTPIGASHQLLHAPIALPCLTTSVFDNLGFLDVVAHRKRAREYHTLARRKSNDTRRDSRGRVLQERA